MADHQLCDRTADEILNDLDEAFNMTAMLGTEFGHQLVWDVINSVRDSYALALRALDEPQDEEYPALRQPVLSVEQVAEVEQTVDDYLTNNFGDD